MLRAFSALALCALAGCGQKAAAPRRVEHEPSRAATTTSTSAPSSAERDADVPRVAADAAAVAPATPNIAYSVRPIATARGRGSLHRFEVPLARVSVSFVDLHYQTRLVDALGEANLLINGGYWAYDGAARKIQGLLVVNGQRIAPRAATLRGGVLLIEDAHATLEEPEWNAASARTTLAIQCNPRLVRNGELVEKLENRRLAARTALCVRDRGQSLDAYLTAEDTRLTLTELAAFLRSEGCEQALNLDGGPSTAAVFRGIAGETQVGIGVDLPYGLAFTQLPH